MPHLLLLLMLLGFSTTSLADVTGIGLAAQANIVSVDGTKVRLEGIDMPEPEQTCRKSSADWRCGYDALDTLRRWIYTKEVRCIGSTSDAYGRLSGECFVDGYSLNARLISEGWAIVDLSMPTRYKAEENAARSAQKGLWSSEFVTPAEWRAGRRL